MENLLLKIFTEANLNTGITVSCLWMMFYFTKQSYVSMQNLRESTKELFYEIKSFRQKNNKEHCTMEEHLKDIKNRE
ncbi:MAG: hypothetical protein GY817_04715 [bacterium]|nr:hypothetical protein [bacterium]